MTSAASPTGRAHPRSRGENWSDRLYTSDTWGSSPLTRGKPARRGLEGMVRRLIPAHAGKTTSTTMIGTNPAAHPRSRGENPPAVAWKVWSGGSSPLTRGKQPSPPSLCTETRLIPAHAGKTASSARPSRPSPAHPRSRGENASTPSGRLGGSGSSPLTRGKPCRRVRSDTDWGLIPAHAGKTPKRRAMRTTDQAHPRSRGENVHDGWSFRVVSGSSPLTRGKPPAIPPTARPTRLIPAHAGKTDNDAHARRVRRAHPRSRGENEHITDHR